MDRTTRGSDASLSSNGYTAGEPTGGPGSRSGSASKYMSKKPIETLKFTLQPSPKGDIFDDPAFEHLLETGEINLGDRKIKISANDIETGFKLGQGQYGHVYQCCIRKEPNLKFAYKDICLDLSAPKKKSILAELEVTERVKDCPYAIQTYCRITSGINLWLIMELMDMSASDLINKSEEHEPKMHIPEPVVRTISYSCVKCLSYLKSLDIMHRDVKPSNILIRVSTGEVKLGDFGICGKLENSMAKSKIYQYNYLAPERITRGTRTRSDNESNSSFSKSSSSSSLSSQTDQKSGRSGGYTVKSDIWAVGITTYELATGEHPFYVEYQLFKTWNNIVELRHKKVSEVATNVSKELDEFVDVCLHKDPQMRPGYMELLENSFIKSFDPINDPLAVTNYCKQLLGSSELNCQD